MNVMAVSNMMILEEIWHSFSKWVNEAFEELEESAEDLKAFCSGFQDEVKNSAHKPTFLVPKTPVAKRLRKIKSKKNENVVQESNAEVRTTRSTRNTAARSMLEINIEPSKNADKKIVEDEKDTARVSEGRKRTREEDTEVQEGPRKTRRVGKKRAMDKGGDVSETKCGSPISVVSEVNNSVQSVVATDVKCAPVRKRNAEQEVESGVNNITKSSSENESITDSAIGSQATSDRGDTNISCTSDNQRAGSARSVDLFQNVENEVESSVSEEPSVNNANIPHKLSKKGILQEHKLCNTTVTISTPTEKNTSIVNNSSDEKNTSNIPANSTFVSSVKLELIQQDVPTEAIKQKDAIRANFSPIVKIRKLSISEVKTLADVTGKTNSSLNVKKGGTKVPPDALPKAVFSPYARSPVKDKVAAFEKLRSERERVAQQAALAVRAVEGSAEPVRMTRTKAKALAAAAAAAQTKEQQVDGEKKAEKNAAHLAARRSVNRAKKISVVKERRELEISQDSECGKENSMVNSFSTSVLSSKGKSFTSTSKKYKTTPLLSNSSNVSYSGSRNPGILGSSAKKHYNVVNGFITGVESMILKPTKILGDDLEKRKEEIRRRMEKEEEAKKKKEELLRARTEEHKRKREEKMQKAQQLREIREKEKLEMQIRLEKEKEEKYKLILQEREKTKEQLQLKKQQAQQKAAEMDERRKLEEAARKAKIKEQEEEQQRLQAARKKEQEEHQRHLAEEREAALLREQEAKAQAKLAKEKELREKEAKAKEKMKAAATIKPPVLNKTFDVSHTNKVTPQPNGLINENDYGIEEEGDSDDEEEEAPRRTIPVWARRDVRKYQLDSQANVVADFVSKFFSSEKTTPNILEMFNHLVAIKRSSSAIWRTPPRLSSLPKL